MRIELPWPDYTKLSPNAKRKLHWRRYQPAANAHKSAVFYAAKSQGVLPLNVDRVSMTVIFHEPDARARDMDGCIGAWKHGQDGLAMALGVDDRNFTVTHRMGDPVKGGKVVVVLHGAFADEADAEAFADGLRSAETPAKQGDSA
ncbi:hypothetical protein [Palleronia sp.]|uniref:hypothetical protein n=1 Tax=Palleronia sp. TaxID=1940284 RepID=UPI0035C82323